jgi:hypothetical protein
LRLWLFKVDLGSAALHHLSIIGAVVIGICGRRQIVIGLAEDRA